MRSWLNAVRVINLNKNQLHVLDSTENDKNNIYQYSTHDLTRKANSAARMLKCMAKIHDKLGCTLSKICISKDNLLRNTLKENLATLNDRSGQDSNCIFTIYLCHISEEKLRHSKFYFYFSLVAFLLTHLPQINAFSP